MIYYVVLLTINIYLDIQISQDKQSTMSSDKNLELKLMQTQYKQEGDQETPEPVWNDFQYKQFGNSPKITLSGLSLIILCPLLACAHIKAAQVCSIPIIQFLFVSLLVAFMINYMGIIRRYQLMPFLPEPVFDGKLKRICVLTVIGLILSIFIGWNGSGGIIFAIFWESKRGNKMGYYGYMLAIIIVGSILMEENYPLKKLLEFIPGILFGYVNSTLFTLQQSSIYPIAHQFLLLITICLPMMFPITFIISPSIFQWLVMLVCGASILVTILFIIKLMQTERVSVVMGIFSGLIMIGTSSFGSTLDYIGAIVILVGVVLLIKKQYIDLQY